MWLDRFFKMGSGSFVAVLMSIPLSRYLPPRVCRFYSRRLMTKSLIGIRLNVGVLLADLLRPPSLPVAMQWLRKTVSSLFATSLLLNGPKLPSRAEKNHSVLPVFALSWLKILSGWNIWIPLCHEINQTMSKQSRPTRQFVIKLNLCS